MTKERLETMLYNAIICWYDDSFIEYGGLYDEEFVNRVCDETGLTREEYIELMGEMNE